MLVEIANSNDIPDLVNLLSVLFSQEHEFTPNGDAQAKGLGKIISDPDIGDIVVARLDGKIVGMVNLLYTVSTALGSKVCILEDMVVFPNARGKSTGSEIMNFAIAHARKMGCLRITLLTDTENVSAQRFYKRFGFSVSTMLPFRLSLSDNT